MFIDKIIELAEESGIPYQLEVEALGSSDGGELQRSPVLFDWCFVGAPQLNSHTPHEKVNKTDVVAMMDLYAYLMKRL